MSKRYGTTEVQALLAKPARIACIETKTGKVLRASDMQVIILLQNHNALVIELDETGEELRYVVITAEHIAAIVMEVEYANQEDPVSSIS